MNRNHSTLSESNLMKRFLLPTICLFAAGLIPCRGETLVALYSNNRLRYFESATPGTFTRSVDITGLIPTEEVVALDFDPRGELVVVTRESSTIFLYRVNHNTGAATKDDSPSLNWTGTAFGFDFLPTANGNVANGVLTSTTDLLQRYGTEGATPAVTMVYDNSTSDGDPVDQNAGDNPAIVALACSNNFPEAASTVLYGIDSTPNTLVVVDRNTGELNTVGPLGTATGTRCGFDISGTTGTAYAALSSGDSTTLLTVDLGSGTTKSVGTLGAQFQQVGVSLVDIAVLPPTRLLNISTRTRVGTGEDVMIAGFTAVGGSSSRLIIRGLGPSLAAFGIASPLPNPHLTIFDANGAIASNDNWKSDQEAAITASQLAPSHDLEAAFLGTFAPGAYTAILRDANDATGVGIIEVYKLTDQ